MTDSDSQEKAQLLKADVMGRVRSTRKQRDVILDAFETGALSGPEFAQVHGIKYQTFATWRQKRRRLRGDFDKTKQPSKPAALELTLAEVVIKNPATPVTVRFDINTRARIIIERFSADSSTLIVVCTPPRCNA